MEPRWRQKVQSKGLCWWLIGPLGAKTVVFKNGVSPRREPHFRAAQGQDKAKIRPKWRYDGAKMAYVEPGLDLGWPMLTYVGPSLGLPWRPRPLKSQSPVESGSTWACES